MSYVYALVRLSYAANSTSLVCVCDLRMMFVSSVRPFGMRPRNAFETCAGEVHLFAGVASEPTRLSTLLR